MSLNFDLTNDISEKIKREPLGSGYFVMTTNDFKFSLDSLLLADFCKLKNEKKICDLCSGCGIVSMLFSADGSRRETLAIEIQQEACELINKTVELNHLENIKIINQDLKLLDKSLNNQFDLVACNPPYKQNGTGKKSTSQPSLIARHEEFCTLDDVISVSSKLLKQKGRLILCHRPERLCDIITTMRQYKIEPKRLRFVQQRKDTKPWLILIEGKKDSKNGLLVEPTLIIEEDNNNYSAEMSIIYNKFNFNINE